MQSRTSNLDPQRQCAHSQKFDIFPDIESESAKSFKTTMSSKHSGTEIEKITVFTNFNNADRYITAEQPRRENRDEKIGKG